MQVHNDFISILMEEPSGKKGYTYGTTTACPDRNDELSIDN